MRVRLWISVLVLVCGSRTGFTAVQELSVDKNVVKDLGHGLYQIGKVRLNQKKRTITIPASVNMSQGTVEYFLVHKTGKTHESVLRTEAEPYHVHLAMLLIGAHGKGTNEFPADANHPPPGDPIKVEVIGKAGEKVVQERAEGLVWDNAAKRAMKELEWVYTGSMIDADGFAAQRNGSIISLIDDPEALINNPLPLRKDDDNWKASEGHVPAVGSPVEVIITLLKK